MRTSDDPASVGTWAILLLTVLVTLITFRIQPQLLANLTTHPWGVVFPAIALAGLLGIFLFTHGEATTRRQGRAFLSSCAYLLGMLTSAAFGHYPYVLPVRGGPTLSLTIYNARTSDRGLRLGLAWWIVGMILATVYFLYLYHGFAGKVRSGENSGYE